MKKQRKENQEALAAELSEKQSGRKHWMLDIHVTKEIIDNAERQKSSNCMVADSIKARAKAAGAQITNVQVDKQSIRLDMNGKRRIWWTPPVIAKDIDRFERGFRVKPFKFELRSGRELQVTDVPERREITTTAKMRTAAARKAWATRRRGKLESTVVTRPARGGKRGRQVDYVRVREVGGEPFPRISNKHRRVFGHKGFTLAEFGPEYEAWVRSEVDRRVAVALKK
jgi:hypothetical protein